MSTPIIPRSVTTLAEKLSNLPGIGPKMASRLAIYLAVSNAADSAGLQNALLQMQNTVTTCPDCGNLAEGGKCAICMMEGRDPTQLMVVETPSDLVALESSGLFNGRYLVLGGVMSPLNGVGVEQLNIGLLENRLERSEVTEVIIALPATVEGDATAEYIRQFVERSDRAINVTQLGKGVPTGANIEYLDKETLRGAMSRRA